MSNQTEKIKMSKRRLQEENAIKKQLKIGKIHGLDKILSKESHRLAKHHVMDCGNPKCPVCSNPRRLYKQLTIQEQRLMQDTDNPNNRHSNGDLHE